MSTTAQGELFDTSASTMRKPKTSQTARQKQDVRTNEAFLRDAEKYGNKTANLMELERLLQQQDSRLATVTIPPFYGVDGAAIAEHIRAQCPGFDSIWKAFEKRCPKGPSTLPDSASSFLTTLRERISSAFEREFPVDNQFLSGLDGQRLMVRSSGREDTEQVVNAGGNLSIAAVEPASVPLTQAIGEVVQSYFGEKSIRQRLIAGDDPTILPKMSVLLQVMVGERSNGPVVASGVLFTREPEGSTPGVMKIQATWGHNEGVVSNSVASDSYYVDPQGKVHEVRREKRERWVPTYQRGREPLERHPNPVELQRKGTLDPELLDRLCKMGKAIEDHYGRPMDIEWTYDPEKDVIYLLQARPLLPSLNAGATRVDLEKTRECPTLATSVIGSGDGKVRLIGDPSEILPAKTLGEALERYLANPNRDTIQAVMTGAFADATSHEATTFRGESIPVVWAQDLDRAYTFIDANRPVLLDPGSGLLVGARPLLGDSSADRAHWGDLKELGVVTPGWSKHPLPAQESIGSRPVDIWETARFIHGIYAQLNPHHSEDPDARALLDACARRDEEAVQTHLARVLREVHRSLPAAGDGTSVADGENRLERLVNSAARGDERERTQAIATLLFESFKLTRMASRNPELKERAEEILRAVTARASAAHDQATQAPGSMTHLYELNWLKAALVQPSESDLVAADSYLTLLNDYAKGADDYASSYALVKKLALRPEVAARWKAFSSEVAANPALNQRLARMMATTQSLGMTTTWLNTSFAEHCVAETGRSCDALLARLEEELSDSNVQKALRWSQEQKAELESWQRRISEWANPSRVEELLEKWSEQVAPKFAEAAAHYRAASPLGKRAVLRWLGQAVDLQDQSLKSLKGSSAFPDTREKVRHFHTLLGPYLAAMFAWTEEVPRLADYGYQNVRKHFERLQEMHNAYAGGWRDLSRMTTEDAAKELLPSGEFQLEAARIGGAATLFGNQPYSLEDLFMLVHQNLLTIMAAAQKDSGLNLDSLPEAVREIADGLGKAKGEPVGVDYSYPRLSVEYSRSLNEHSMKSRIEYDVREPGRARVSVDFYGAHENNRHNRVKMYAALFSRSLGLSFAPEGSPNTKSRATTWTWDLPLEGKAAQRFRDALPRLLEEVAKTTGFEDRHHRLDDVVGRLEKFVPEIESTIRGLDYSFFLNHPWFNIEFAKRLTNAPNIGEILRVMLDSDGACDDDFQYFVVREARTISKKVDPAVRRQIASSLREALDQGYVSLYQEKEVAKAIRVYDGKGFMRRMGM